MAKSVANAEREEMRARRRLFSPKPGMLVDEVMSTLLPFECRGDARFFAETACSFGIFGLLLIEDLANRLYRVSDYTYSDVRRCGDGREVSVERNYYEYEFAV